MRNALLAIVFVLAFVVTFSAGRAVGQDETAAPLSPNTHRVLGVSSRESTGNIVILDIGTATPAIEEGMECWLVFPEITSTPIPATCGGVDYVGGRR
jgi:hypothetical protein